MLRPSAAVALAESDPASPTAVRWVVQPGGETLSTA
eukprot:SAG11_NODE_37795_length_255_cov_0.666667_1_plen_35_part_01